MSVELRKRSSSQKNRFSALPPYMTQYGEEKFTEIFKTITADNGSEFDTLSELKILVEGYNYKTWLTLDFFYCQT